MLSKWFSGRISPTCVPTHNGKLEKFKSYNRMTIEIGHLTSVWSECSMEWIKMWKNSRIQFWCEPEPLQLGHGQAKFDCQRKKRKWFAEKRLKETVLDDNEQILLLLYVIVNVFFHDLNGLFQNTQKYRTFICCYKMTLTLTNLML